MKEITQFEKHVVEIWRRPRQRHMHLRVRPDGALRITCHRRVAKAEIFAFLRESENFITKSLLALKAQDAQLPPKTYVSGENFLYLGRHLPLEIIWSWNPRIKVRPTGDTLEMIAPLSGTPASRQKALHAFMQKRAREMFFEKVARFSAQMELRPISVSVRGQKTRWGSCTSEGRLNLNWKLLAAPEFVIDYVVIHELAHLAQMNHSPKFWAIVEKFYPGYQIAKNWLKSFEPEIRVQFQKAP